MSEVKGIGGLQWMGMVILEAVAKQAKALDPRSFFAPDPLRAELKEIARRERRVKNILRGEVSRARILQRRSSEPVKPASGKLKVKLEARIDHLEDQRQVVKTRQVGQKLAKGAALANYAIPGGDILVHFAAFHLDSDPTESRGQRIFRASVNTLATKGRQIAVALLIVTVTAYLL